MIRRLHPHCSVFHLKEGCKVRLAIDAPKEVSVLRRKARKRAGRRRAMSKDSELLMSLGDMLGVSPVAE